MENSPFRFNQSVWVIKNDKKYRGFYQGPTRYGLMHWVANKPQKRKRNETTLNKWSWSGTGWCVEIGEIFTRRKDE